MVDIATEVEPELGDVIAAIVEAVQDQRHGPILGEVQSYDSSKQICDVKPIIAVVIDGEFSDLPVIRCVPVLWPGGGQGAFTAPLTPGDVGQLIPQMGDISGWQTHGAVGQTPADPRRGSLTDMAFVPRYRPMSNPLPSQAVAADGPVVYGPVAVYLGGSDAADFVALASKSDFNWDEFKKWADAHIHTTPSGPSGVPTVPSPTPSAVGSIVVKAK